MSLIIPSPSKPVQPSVFSSLPIPSSGSPARGAGPLLLALASSLLIAAAMAPVTASAELVADSAPVMSDKLDIEYEDPDPADDGSSALPQTFKLYGLQDVEPISAKDEEALLGDWGDSDAEDGD